MKALALVLTLILDLGMTSLSAEAWQKAARVGELFFTDPSTSSPFQQALRDGLRDLGYIEGQNIAFETRWAHSRESLLGQHAEELARHNVAVLLVGNISALQAARQATKTIPIVMVGFGDAVGEGFVTNLAHPGGNGDLVSPPRNQREVDSTAERDRAYAFSCVRAD